MWFEESTETGVPDRVIAAAPGVMRVLEIETPLGRGVTAWPAMVAGWAWT